MDKFKVSVEIMKDKIQWELRGEGGEGGQPPGRRSGSSSNRRRRPQERKMEFRSKRVTDMPTNRFVHIPNSAGPEVETVLDNISCRVNTFAKAYLYISKKV